MYLTDGDCPHKVTIGELYRDYLEVTSRDDFPNFGMYLFTVLEDTIRDKNDCEIHDITPRELNAIFDKLESYIIYE